MKVSIATGGRFYAFHLAGYLAKKGLLQHLFTGSYSKNDEKEIPKALVKNNKLFGLLDIAYDKFRLSHVISPSPWYVFKDGLFDEWVKRLLLKERDKPDIFVGWSNYCLKSLAVARKKGAKIIVESASSHILYKDKLLRDEYEKYNISFTPISKKNSDKMLKEYDQADYIIVPSKFVFRSFIGEGIPEGKMLRIPTGCGVNLDKFLTVRNEKPSKFRVIFVGLVGLRKGVHYLLDAWNKLDLPKDKTELLIVGGIEKNFLKLLKGTTISPNVRFYGGISQEYLKELYKLSSVFILPSIEEGLALVQAEAMATGLPIIGTTNSGCEELIHDGEEGFVLPIRNLDSIVEKIRWCYDNQDLCFEMGKKAQERVKMFTWERFGDKVVELYSRTL